MAIEPEEVFLVMFVLSFVSMIILRKGKGDMRGRVWTCVVIDGTIGGYER